MKDFFSLLLIIFLVLLELTVIPHLSFRGVRPDFLLLVLISWFILRPPREASLLLVISGLLLDLFSPLPFGVISLSFYIVLLTLWLLPFKNYSRSNLGFIILGTILGTIIYNVFLLIWISGFRFIHLTDFHFDFQNQIYSLLPKIGLNLLLMYFVFKMMRFFSKLFKKFAPHEI